MSSHEHLDKEALCDSSTASQLCLDIDSTRNEDLRHTSRGNGSDELRKAQDDGAVPGEVLGEEECERDCGVEQTTTDAEEEPSVRRELGEGRCVKNRIL